MGSLQGILDSMPGLSGMVKEDQVESNGRQEFQNGDILFKV